MASRHEQDDEQGIKVFWLPKEISQSYEQGMN